MLQKIYNYRSNSVGHEDNRVSTLKWLWLEIYEIVIGKDLRKQAK